MNVELLMRLTEAKEISMTEAYQRLLTLYKNHIGKEKII